MRAPNRSSATLLAVLTLALLSIGACSTDDQEATDTTTGTSPGGGTDETVDCAWAVRADKATLNIAYPDTGATYWALSYSLAPGETIELAGTFPEARYASFISYPVVGSPLDVLTDRDIEPDAGSTNPFATGELDDGDHAYTVVLDPATDRADEPNVVGVANPAADPAAPGTSLPGTGEATNVLGSGGADDVIGTTVYRVYVPDDSNDPTGGAGLPSATVVAADGSRTAVPTCAEPGPSPTATALVETFGRSTDTTPPDQPTFIRPTGAGNLFPNPDNVYIATTQEHRPGEVVVLQGLAPTFPDPTAGRPIGGDEQVRYWSLCSNEFRKPYPVSYCVIDRDVVLDEEGRYTVVISTPEDRPANANAEDGVTWLDWGSTEVNLLILLRHMLASPDFPESAINVEPGALATTTMGAYAPTGVRCATTDFEAGGAEACGL